MRASLAGAIAIAMAIAVVITVVVLAPTEMTFPSEKPNLSRRENNNDDAG